MSKMHATVFNKFGDPAKVLCFDEWEMPEPGEGEVRVRLVMSPIHNHNLILIKGEYGYKPRLPFIGGSEAVGIVDKLGEGVTRFSEGDRVSVSSAEYAWADYFIAKAEDAVAVPDGVSDEQAAQLMGMPVDGVAALDKLEAKKGDWIVINAANGAVGKVVSQVATARGVNVVNLVSRSGALDDLEAIGVKNVFVTSEKDWQEKVRGLVGMGRVAGGIDMVSGPLAGEMIKLLSEGAIFLSFGAMSGEPVTLDPSDMIFKELTFKGFWGHKEIQRASPAYINSIVAELVDLMSSDKLKLPVASVYPLDHVDEAVKASANKRNGKILLSPAKAA